MVLFVWRQRFYCLITSRTFSWDSSTKGDLDFLSAVWSLKNDLRENKLIQFLDWLMEKRWTPHSKCDFQKGSIDVWTIVFFFFFFFACKFSIVNCLSMRGKHPTKAAACCNGGKLFFMERWIAVVPARDVQVQINHFILLFGVKSRKEGIVEAVQASGYVNVLGTG